MSRPAQPLIGITQERAADAVDQDSAGAAFAEAAAVFRTVEREIVAQHVEQRRSRAAVISWILPFTVRRIGVCVILVPKSVERALQIPSRSKSTLRRYRLYTNVQAAHAAVQRECLLCGQSG